LPYALHKTEDEKEEMLSDATYAKRITRSFFMKAGRGVSAKLLHADLLDVVNRLETTNELACKGVRYGVSETEAHQSIIQAYLLLGALIRACCEGVSPILYEESVDVDFARDLMKDR